MNALNEFGKQIGDLFKSMTPASRIMAGLMLGVIVVSLGWIVGAQQSSEYEYLLGGRSFTEGELADLEEAFSNAGLRDYDRVGERVKIPTATKDVYVKAMSEAQALPAEWGTYIDKAINGGSPFDPNSLIEKRYESGKERELASVIQRIPDIEFAAVEFDEQRMGFGRKTNRVCSISVQARGNRPVPIGVMKHIAQIAAKSFAGLEEDNISVNDLGAAQTYRPASDPNAADQMPYYTQQSQWEQKYQDKVAEVLSPYGAVKLAVNVELDPTLLEETEKLEFDPATVTVQATSSRKDLENAKVPPSGPPGAGSNGVSNQPKSISANAVGQTSKTKESEENERKVAGHSATVTKTAGLVPRKVTVSVGIPDSYYRQVWAYRTARDNPDTAAADVPPPAATDLATIKTEVESSVRSAIEGIPVGIREGDDRQPFINVYSYTDLPFPEIPGPSFAETSLAWLGESWATIALIGLVFVSLGMMYSWVKSQGLSEKDAKFAEGFGLEIPDNLGDELELSGSDDDGKAPSDGMPKAKPAFEVTGQEIRDDVSTMIKDNPDAAVNLLKSWIGEAA